MTGVDPEKTDTKVSMSVFEKCCQTPGSAEFIKACIEWGCDVNKVKTEFCLWNKSFCMQTSSSMDNLILALLSNHSLSRASKWLH